MSFHAFPVKGMVEIAPTVVSHCHRLLADIPENLPDGHRFHRGTLDGVGEIVIVCLVMFAEMNFYGKFINIRFKGIMSIG
jgi:hypothetical protein